MLWIAEHVVSSLIATLLALGFAFIIFLHRQKPMVTVEIVIDAGLPIPTAKLVITNYGRAPTVITELNVHIPLAQATIHSQLSTRNITLEPDPLPPQWFKIPRSFWIRRKLRIFGSHNAMLTRVAQSRLGNGCAKINVIDQTETITVMPNEKVSHPLVGRDSHPLTPTLAMPATVELIPSCRVAKQKHVAWGVPVIASAIPVGDHIMPVVMSFGWKGEPSL